jgi:hypothetical protein
MLKLVTIVTPDFWPGFAALLQSVTENGHVDSRRQVCWLVICDQESAPKTWIASRSENIALFPIAGLPRIKVLSEQNQGERMENALQKLGIFALPEELGTCVYLDSDMVCLNSIAGLEAMSPICAAYDHFQLSDHEHPLLAGQFPEYNTGVLVFAPSHKTFEELSETYRRRHGERSHKGDQDVFFFWSQGKSIHPLGSEWNFSKRHQDAVGREWIRRHLSEIRFLHFVGAKPWTSNSKINTFRECHYRYMEELWWDYFEASGLAAHMVDPPRRSTALLRQWILPWTKPAILKEHCVRGARLLRRFISKFGGLRQRRDEQQR